MILFTHDPSRSPGGGWKEAGEGLDPDVQILLRIVTISWGPARLGTCPESYSSTLSRDGHFSREVYQGLCFSLWIRHRDVKKIMIHDSQKFGYKELLQLSECTS